MKLLISFLCLIPIVYSIKIENLPGQPKVRFNQYSGYLNVGKNKTHHLHYWFVESRSSPETDPLVLWLNGGPGCSSLLGFFGENGPFTLKTKTEMVINPHSWNLNASVLYLESPANNVGYSYTDDPKDINTNDDQTITEKWEGLFEFFKAYPQFRENDFYITGESYAGIYLPLLAGKILDSQDRFHINLRGMAIGNGLMDKKLSDDTFLTYYDQHALIDHRAVTNYLRACCDGDVDKCSEKETPECKQANEDLEEVSSDPNALVSHYNVYQYCDPLLSDVGVSFGGKTFWHKKQKLPACDNLHEIRLYFDRSDVRQALGIPKKVHEYHNCVLFQKSLFNYDQQYPSQYAQVARALRGGVKTMLYYGDFDTVCNVMHGQRFAEQFIKDRNFMKWYKVNGYAAGLWVQEGNLRFVTVRGAGHMVPTDRPIIAKHILDKFIDWTKLS